MGRIKNTLLSNDGQAREKKIKPRNNHGRAINEKKMSANKVKYTSYFWA